MSDSWAEMFSPANDFFEMELIGDHSMLVGVPIDAPETLKRNVVAAIKATYMNFSSIDYVVKRYGQQWKFPPSSAETIELVNSLREMSQKVTEMVEALSAGIARPEHMGLFAAEMALIRLDASFRSAILLIRHGYPFEAAAICRLILEQLGWILTVHGKTELDDIISVKPQSTIGRLKALLPKAGRIYGILSNQAHMDPKDNRHYVGYDSEKGSAVVRFYLPEETKIILNALRVLTDLYVSIVRYVSGDYIKDSLQETAVDRLLRKTGIKSKSSGKSTEPAGDSKRSNRPKKRCKSKRRMLS